MNWINWLFPSKSATSPAPVTSVPLLAPETAVPLMSARAPSPVDWHHVVKNICPQGHAAIIDGLADSMPGLCAKFDLTTPLRQAHFLAQIAEESAGLTTAREEGDERYLRSKRYYPWFGRGLIQITWEENYRAMSKALAVDFISNPSLMETFPHAANVAGVFWKQRNINRPADKDDLREVTRLINGGENGIGTRAIYLRRAKLALRRT